MFKIAIMGCGVVGSGVADILIDQEAALSKRFNEKVCLDKILDVRDIEGTPYAKYLTKDADVIWNDADIKLVVMTIGGLDFAYNLTKKALESGRHVVTSNKEVVAAYGVELTKIAFEHNVRFLYEASAGGGIPVIRPLNICLSGNDIYEIQGILNGTTNYILTKMSQEGVSFEDALKEAQQKGYAEADPTADVDGHDAARKIAILSSIAYKGFVDYKDVKCTGIRKITSEDHKFAEKAGYAIKLIGRSRLADGKVSISVEPLLLPGTNLLSAVNSVFNAVLVKGSYIGDTLFYGAGAGKLPTASAVVGDVIEILGNPTEATLPDFTEKNAVINKADSSKSKKLVRFTSRANAFDVEKFVSEEYGATFLGSVNDKYGIITAPVSDDEYVAFETALKNTLNAVIENAVNIVE